MECASPLALCGVLGVRKRVKTTVQDLAELARETRFNPEGIAALSPRLASRRAYLGSRYREPRYPKGGCGRRYMENGHNPVGVGEKTGGPWTQGSAKRATAGLEAGTPLA